MQGRHLLGVVAFAAAACVGASLLGNDFQLRIAFTIGTYYLCAAGMNVLVGFAGQKSLGQAGLFAAGAYSVALLTTRFDWNPWLALVGALVVSAIFGALIAWPSLRVRGPYLAMVTLAFGIVVEKLVSEWTEVFGGAQGVYGVKALTFGGTPLTPVQWVWLVIVLGAVTHVLLRNLLTGRFGRAFMAVQADEIAAGSSGVNVYRYKVLAFIIAGVTCGLAGALVAQFGQYINSDYITFNLSIFILLLVMFGGSGSLMGPLIGAVLLTLIDSQLARWPAMQHFGYGTLLLFALYAMPDGVAGLFARFVKREPSAAQAGAGGRPLQAVIPPSGQGTLLEVDNLSKSFGGIKPVQNVSFSMRPGKIHALIGPNGAGKSTMMNLISGVIPASEGRIAFLGKNINEAASHEICTLGIARTFQNLRLFAALPVIDNILIGRHARMSNGFASSLFGLPSARAQEREARAQAQAVVDFSGLGPLANQPAGSLAYGLQRRVELARALAAGPQLLLLDEPAAGLNPQETAELGELIQRIGNLGITILMVEHHMDMVMKISDHIIVLDYGIKIAEGTPQEVRSNPRVIEAYLGAPAAHQAEAVATAQ